MEIESTTFGTITIDGKTYEHDVIIRLSGEVVKRKKKLSKKYYGTSHVLSKDEAKFVFERGMRAAHCWLGPDGFFGDYCSGIVWSLRMQDGKAMEVRREPFRVSTLTSFGEDAAGELYFATGNGRIFKLTA